MRNDGGRTRLWLNDGTGHFSDATAERMPDVLVKFSWELEFVDVDNDYDLDLAISCKTCGGSFLFENDGTGQFADVTDGRLPQFANNYEFETLDLDGDGYLELVTINDGMYSEHVFANRRDGGFANVTEEWWPTLQNLSYDDNMIAFLDFDSDGDADFLIGSLDGPDRLMINDGTGHLKRTGSVLAGKATPGTLGIALADLNGDARLDLVMAQGENATNSDERVFLGTGLEPDTAPPVISLVEPVSATAAGGTLQVRARIHDNKSPTMPHDWQSVVLRWTVGGETHETPMQWYGEYLWRAVVPEAPPDTGYQVCATDAVGNEACSPMPA
jgi:hypothetical protein